MAYVLTEDSLMVCNHELGKVALAASQKWMTINGRAVLIRPDPEAKRIDGCLNANLVMGIVPCTVTLAVHTGYSTWIRVDGLPVCLDTVEGLTNGTPQGGVKYKVKSAGQSWVSEGS